MNIILCQPVSMLASCVKDLGMVLYTFAIFATD